MIFWKMGSKRAGARYGKELYADDIHELWDKTGAAEMLAERYAADCKALIDLEIASGEFYECEREYGGGGDERCESVLLGSVFSLYPSGKFWTFWACSNLDMREMVRDTIYTEMLEREAEERGCWIESGEGDPCDLFLCRAVEGGGGVDDDEDGDGVSVADVIADLAGAAERALDYLYDDESMRALEVRRALESAIQAAVRLAREAWRCAPGAGGRQPLDAIT